MPLWVMKHLPGEGDFLHHREVDDKTGAERRWRADEPDFKVKRVCRKHCNNGWMSDLEGEVQSIIGGLMKGHGRTLHQDGQRLVAFWAVKTAMMWQFAGSLKPIPASDMRQLYERRVDRQLPDGTQVWIGSCVAEAGFHNDQRLGLEHSVTGEKRYGYGSTFSIGHLAFQVFGNPFGNDVARRHFKPGSLLSRAFIQIWPYEGPVTLPPEIVFTLPQLEQAAEAF